MYYAMITAAVVLLALQFCTNRAFGLKCGSAAEASLTFSALSGFFSAVISAAIAAATGGIKFTPYSLIMGSLVAVLCCAYTFIGFRIMALGSLSVFTMFLMLGGMMLPYLYGVFALNENVTVCRIIGFILLAVSLVFPVISKEKGKDKGGEKSRGSLALFLILCAAVFCLNGLVSIVSKIHQTDTLHETCSAASFSVITNFLSGVIASAGILAIKIRQKDKKLSAFTKAKPSFIFLITFLGAACNGISYILQLFSAGKVDASVLYPMITGGTVVLSALAGRIIFKEKQDKISAFGLALSFAATCLFIF